MSATRTKDDPIRIAADALGESLRTRGGSLAVNGETVATIEADAVSGHVTDAPHDRPFVPPDEHFGDEDFLEARSLEHIGAALIGRYPEFAFLRDALAQDRLAFVWKRRGGKSGGKGVWGKCQRPSGLLRFFSQMEFVIWIAADYAAAFGWTNLELEALLFHELKHCGWEENEETGDVKLIVVAHDDQLFWDELKRYGAWKAELRQTGRVYAQVALPGGGS